MIHRFEKIKAPIRTAVFMVILLCTMIAKADPIDDFKASPSINAPEAAVLIMDLKDGNVLASHNADTPLIPASIMKAVTIAGLLEQSAPDRKYITRVGHTGSISDGVLEGDIVITGSGDPSLNSAFIEGNSDFCREIVEALKAYRLKKISGDIVIDESVFSGPACPPTWASGDLPHSYGTGQHGFNFSDNASGKKSIANPAAVFKNRLNALLREAGIELTGIPSNLGKNAPVSPFFEHRSATFDEIMRSCMMRSDNQYAESMLRTIAVLHGRPGSTEEGARLNTDFWKKKKVPMSGVNIIDGSGLSRSNRVTANFMAGVLKEMSGNPYYASFFPLAGQEGTLKSFLKDTPLDGYIAMKTGSMNGIQCYAGYKLDDDYVPTHVVVVIMNKMANRTAARAAVARMLLEIFEES